MDAPQFYYYRNDTLIEITGVKDESTGDYINNATVEVTAKDAAGTQIAGQNWPLTLSYIAGTDGTYRGILEAALTVTVGDQITVEVHIDGGSGREAFFEIPVRVRQRGKVYY